MTRKYQVAIADVDRQALTELQEILTRAGHFVIALASSSDSLVSLCETSKPELIICDLRLSTGDSLNSLQAICEKSGIPVIVTSDFLDEELIDRAAECQVFGVLAKPIRETELMAMITVVAHRFHEFQQLREETSCLRKALDDRRIIEQAKGIIMKKCTLDEEGAFRHLQHLARQHRQKLIDVAKGVLIAESAFAGVNVKD